MVEFNAHMFFLSFVPQYEGSGTRGEPTDGTDHWTTDDDELCGRMEAPAGATDP